MTKFQYKEQFAGQLPKIFSTTQDSHAVPIIGRGT